MPPVGGFVALCVHNRGEPETQKTKIHGDFFKIKVTLSSDTIKGKLMINYNAYRICHGGIKVRLEGLLQVMGKVSTSKPIDILEHRPTETILSCGDLMRGQNRLTFTLKIPPGHPFPTAFMTSNGSLTYRLVALIQRDNMWEIIAKKLVNFKGYYNVQDLELNPMVDRKRIQTKIGEVKSTFTVPSTVVVMGCCESLNGTLELQGLSENQVNATLTLFRNINYGGNIHTESILSQSRQAEVHENTAIFKWKVVVPMISRISYSNELFPMYSVRYYLKYEVFFGELYVEEQNFTNMRGMVEVQVGNARDPCGSKTNDTSLSTINQGGQTSRTPDRRRSVFSLVSLLSLPPAYSRLPSKSGSMISLETLPPQYDELGNNN